LNIFRMARSFVQPYQPSFLVMFVTSRCNARCPFCFYAERTGSATGPEELTTEEFERISRKCGKIPYLLLSGGEPSLRDDLEVVTGFFVQNAGAQFVTIPSNGLLPERTVSIFDRLTSTFPGVHFRSAFSVDFPDRRHDEMRGVPGCLDSIVEATRGIRELKRTRPNLSLDVVTVYMKENEHIHPELREWVRESIRPDNHELHLIREDWPDHIPAGLDLDCFLVQAEEYASEGRMKETRNLSAFFRGLNDQYIRSLGRLVRGERISKCFAGRKITVIDETGKVRLCEFRREILGDLRQDDYDLRRILRRSRGLFRKMNREKCTCTWECAVSTNIVCSVRFHPRLLLSAFKELLRWR